MAPSENEFDTPGLDGGIGKQASPSHTTTAKITTRLQNKYHPDLSENPAVWKSNNQRFKEATFIQTGRRGGDVERLGEVWRGAEMQSGLRRQENRWSNIHKA